MSVSFPDVPIMNGREMSPRGGFCTSTFCIAKLVLIPKLACFTPEITHLDTKTFTTQERMPVYLLYAITTQTETKDVAGLPIESQAGRRVDKIRQFKELSIGASKRAHVS
jgi:hypothetical protein